MVNSNIQVPDNWIKLDGKRRFLIACKRQVQK